MALSESTVLEVRTDGDDTNGGGFVTGASGTDWSQQAAAQYSVTDGVTAGTTSIVSATANFGTDVVGNLIYVEGGTGSVAAAWYQIISRTNATTIVVDRSTGLTAGTGATLKIGGALASPGGLGLVLANHGVNGMHAYIKSGTYTLSNTTTNTSGGPLSLSANTRRYVEGYDSTRGDLGTRPIISAGAQTSITVITLATSGNNFQEIINIDVDGNSQTGVTGFSTSFGNSGNVFRRCRAYNCDASSSTIGFNNGGLRIDCEAYNNGIGFSGLVRDIRCSAHDNVSGWGGANQGGLATECVAYSNTGIGFVSANQPGTQYVGCTAYGNTSDGFSSNQGNGSYFDCVSVGNGGYGFNVTGVDNLLYSCATYNNTSGRSTVSATTLDRNPITLTGDPFTNAAGADFSPNNTAGAGADLRNAGIDVYGQTDNRDIGSVQHADPAGGGGLGYIIGG